MSKLGAANGMVWIHERIEIVIVRYITLCAVEQLTVFTIVGIERIKRY